LGDFGLDLRTDAGGKEQRKGDNGTAHGPMMPAETRRGNVAAACPRR
jgi:hypothetical protein